MEISGRKFKPRFEKIENGNMLREICLTKWSGVLFTHQVGPNDINFFSNNELLFRDMWKTQGESFWVKFVLSLRNVAMSEIGYSPFEFDWVFVDFMKRLTEKSFDKVCDHITNVTKVIGYDKADFKVEQFIRTKTPDQRAPTKSAIRSIYGDNIENLSKDQLDGHYSLTLRCAGAFIKFAHVWKENYAGFKVHWQRPKFWSSTALALPMEIFLQTRFGPRLHRLLDCSQSDLGWLLNPAYPAAAAPAALTLISTSKDSLGKKPPPLCSKHKTCATVSH